MKKILAGRELLQKIGYLLTLTGLLHFTVLNAGAVSAGVHPTFQEKSAMAAPQTATAPTRNIPPLDASQPARVETFTFGLG